MLALILLWLHLLLAWRSTLFASFCVCFRFHSTGTMPHRTAAGHRPNPTRARSRSTNAGTTDPPTAASFRSMSVYDLRHTCRSAGVASEGTKHQLINRLCAHHGVDSPSANPPEPRASRCRSPLSTAPGRNPTRRVDSDRRPGACSSPYGTPHASRQPRNLTI